MNILRTYFGWMKRTDGIILIAVSMLLALGSYTQVLPFSALETVGTISGLISVWLVSKNEVANWPIGLVNSGSFLILFWNFQIWGSMATQIPYLILGVYGWYIWLFGGQDNTEKLISSITWTQVKRLALLAFVGTFGLAWFFHLTNGQSPLMDGFTTALSLVALYLMTIKVIQNWFVWITADVIFIVLYWQNDLKLTSILYIFFLLMCINGYFVWRKDFAREQELSDVAVA